MRMPPRASTPCSDYKVRLGGLDRQNELHPRRSPSGVVSALGAGVTDLAVGEPVFGVTDQGDRGTPRRKAGD